MIQEIFFRGARSFFSYPFSNSASLLKLAEGIEERMIILLKGPFLQKSAEFYISPVGD